MGEVDLFSDASQHGEFYAGAYIIGDGEPVGVLLPEAKTSTQAELMTSREAIIQARLIYPEETLVLHSDLHGIRNAVLRGQGFRILWDFLDGVELKSDGNNFKQHKRCHNMARVMTGKKGSQHPALRRQTKVKPLNGRLMLAVQEVLANHPRGISEMKIGIESGAVSYSRLRKVLRHMEQNGLAACDRLEGVSGCDLTTMIWRAGVAVTREQD